MSYEKLYRRILKDYDTYHVFADGMGTDEWFFSLDVAIAHAIKLFKKGHRAIRVYGELDSGDYEECLWSLGPYPF